MNNDLIDRPSKCLICSSLIKSDHYKGLEQMLIDRAGDRECLFIYRFAYPNTWPLERKLSYLVSLTWNKLSSAEVNPCITSAWNVFEIACIWVLS